MMTHRYPSEYWHRQAQETRQLAAMMSLPRDKLKLVEMAKNYDRQARTANLRWHRESAEQTNAVMRATNADLRRIIRETRALLESSREALHRADLLLTRTPFVRNRTLSELQ